MSSTQFLNYIHYRYHTHQIKKIEVVKGGPLKVPTYIRNARKELHQRGMTLNNGKKEIVITLYKFIYSSN